MNRFLKTIALELLIIGFVLHAAVVALPDNKNNRRNEQRSEETRGRSDEIKNQAKEDWEKSKDKFQTEKKYIMQAFKNVTMDAYKQFELAKIRLKR
jgi:hypothetical protein